MLDLSAIEARANAATPGPWGMRWSDGTLVPRDFTIIEEAGYDLGLLGAMRAQEDATFIAHARQDVPALVAEVRRLRAAINSGGFHWPKPVPPTGTNSFHFY